MASTSDIITSDAFLTDNVLTNDVLCVCKSCKGRGKNVGVEQILEDKVYHKNKKNTRGNHTVTWFNTILRTHRNI